MRDCNFKVEGDLMCLSSEVDKLKGDTITLDCGSVRTYPDGSSCYVVDTGDVYLLYDGTWYKQG